MLLPSTNGRRVHGPSLGSLPPQRAERRPFTGTSWHRIVQWRISAVAAASLSLRTSSWGLQRAGAAPCRGVRLLEACLGLRTFHSDPAVVQVRTKQPRRVPVRPGVEWSLARSLRGPPHCRSPLIDHARSARREERRHERPPLGCRRCPHRLLGPGPLAADKPADHARPQLAGALAGAGLVCRRGRVLLPPPPLLPPPSRAH